MVYTHSNITASRSERNLNIMVPEDQQHLFSSGAVAIRNRSVLEIMAVAVKPKVNTQIGRGASIYSPLYDDTLKFSCKMLALPQQPAQEKNIEVKKKSHSLRNGIHFPILIIDINKLFDMR